MGKIAWAPPRISSPPPPTYHPPPPRLEILATSLYTLGWGGSWKKTKSRKPSGKKRKKSKNRFLIYKYHTDIKPCSMCFYNVKNFSFRCLISKGYRGIKIQVRRQCYKNVFTSFQLGLAETLAFLSRFSSVSVFFGLSVLGLWQNQ